MYFGTFLSTINVSFSLREKFSDPEDEINPLHGADTEEQVQREMNLFFPMETTVAVIKPDVYEKETERGLLNYVFLLDKNFVWL